MNYTKITKTQFDEMQLNAGVLLWRFNPHAPAMQDSDIVCATVGGFGLNAVPKIEDTGQNVYMMPPNTLEMQKVTGWEVEVNFSTISTSAALIKLLLGAADMGASITPRDTLQDEDFTDLWWVGDRLDGGLVAVHLHDVLSEDGISYTSAKNAMGGIDVHMTAHTSLFTEVIPFEIYSVEGRPMFNIESYMHLMAYNIENADRFTVDTNTGQLVITDSGEYGYHINTSTGHMEITT